MDGAGTSGSRISGPVVVQIWWLVKTITFQLGAKIMQCVMPDLPNPGTQFREPELEHGQLTQQLSSTSFGMIGLLREVIVSAIHTSGIFTLTMGGWCVMDHPLGSRTLQNLRLWTLHRHRDSGSTAASFPATFQRSACGFTLRFCGFVALTLLPSGVARATVHPAVKASFTDLSA